MAGGPRTSTGLRRASRGAHGSRHDHMAPPTGRSRYYPAERRRKVWRNSLRISGISIIGRFRVVMDDGSGDRVLMTPDPSTTSSPTQAADERRRADLLAGWLSQTLSVDRAAVAKASTRPTAKEGAADTTCRAARSVPGQAWPDPEAAVSNQVRRNVRVRLESLSSRSVSNCRRRSGRGRSASHRACPRASRTLKSAEGAFDEAATLPA